MEASKNNPLFARMTRRRALAVGGTGALGLSAAALIGCSAGSKATAPAAANKAAATGASSAPETPKRGGTLRYSVDQNPDSLNPYLGLGGGATAGTFHQNVYSTLFAFEPGFKAPATGKVIGDAAVSWEQPDPLTIVAKINPKAKFDQRAPLNGRNLTSDDVLQTWKLLLATPTLAPGLANKANPDAPIADMEAVDASTVRIKLAYPDATSLSRLGGALRILPAEGIAGKFDLSKEMRGTGAFILDSYQPGVSIKFKRNPDWFGGPDKPYVDAIENPIISAQAQLDVQFRAKKLQWSAVSNENIAQFAKDLPGTEIAVGTPNTRSPLISPSFLPGQPWHDIRVRRAVSMAIDRDTLANVLYNPQQFKALGVNLNTYWNAPLSGGYGAFWLDPKSLKFGPAAQYLKYNVAEAKKLLDAAGYTSAKPMEFDLLYPGTTYGTDWPTRVETLQAMLKEAGVKMNGVSVDYATEYVPKIFRGKTLFKGKNVDAAAHLVSGGGAADALLYYLNFYTAKAANTATGTEYPEFEAMLRKQLPVTNFDERVAGVHELNKYAVDNMLVVPAGPYTEFIDLVWKDLRGPQEWNPWSPSVRYGVSWITLLFQNFWFREQF